MSAGRHNLNIDAGHLFELLHVVQAAKPRGRRREYVHCRHHARAGVPGVATGLKRPAVPAIETPSQPGESWPPSGT